MNKQSFLVIAMLAACLLQGCGQDRQPESAALGPAAAEPGPPAAEPQPAVEPQPYVVELRAVGKTFQGVGEIPSGWTTFRFVNASSMVHFAIIDVPPEGVTLQQMNDEVVQPFQDAFDAMMAGDDEAVNAAFGRFPEWIGELGRNGGPGFLSAGRTGQTTVYLEPGNYILECYVKSDGVFHTTSPGEGQIGMMMELVVTEEQNGAPEPDADLVLAIRNDGFEIVDGALQPGTNTVRVDFVEQQALPSFVGNDVHLMRVEDERTIAAVDAWFDWRTENGLEDPPPAEFLGGVNDLPAGAHGYFTVELEPGDYAFVAEVPNPLSAGFVLPVSVAGAD